MGVVTLTGGNDGGIDVRSFFFLDGGGWDIFMRVLSALTGDAAESDDSGEGCSRIVSVRLPLPPCTRLLLPPPPPLLPVVVGPRAAGRVVIAGGGGWGIGAVGIGGAVRGVVVEYIDTEEAVDAVLGVDLCCFFLGEGCCGLSGSTTVASDIEFVSLSAAVASASMRLIS